MISEAELEHIWEDLLAAEVRSLYFADLAAWYTTRKQFVTGASFFLSSGAAATLAAQVPTFVPLVMSTIAAILTAYSMAVSLDGKATAMAKLHSTWHSIAEDYNRLWNHWYDDDAELTFKEILIRKREASELASTNAPYEEGRMEKWRGFVHQQYGIITT